LSHFGNDRDALDGCRAIAQWQLAEFCRFVGRVNGRVSPTGGTLLDKGTHLFGAGLEHSDAHKHTNLPVVTAGSSDGLNATGQHRSFTDVPLANLYRLLAAQMGVNLTSFGDSTGELSW
jgi:hypothetical protein